MGSELMLGGGGYSDDRRAVARRPSRQVRAVQRRGEADMARLLNTGQQQEARAALRKRFTENGMQDIDDVQSFARELVGDDQFLASLLIPIVQEFQRATARDIRDYGRGRGF